MRKIDYFELGATLYIPILQKNLEAILTAEKYPFFKVCGHLPRRLYGFV
ncbi:MAG: hypothetical protein Q9M36_11255 [Sulfurovum sp.]|nr:hypothetical protein [Sulfurovum sp.]